jgi:hypothetical protein
MVSYLLCHLSMIVHALAEISNWNHLFCHLIATLSFTFHGLSKLHRLLAKVEDVC